MSFLKRLEARLGRYAIPNLTLVLVIGQACAWVMSRLSDGPDISRLALDPAKVMDGEWWRVLTFLFSPPEQRGILVIFYFILFHLFGTAVEAYLGTFRYNVFLLTGWIASVVAAFVASAAVPAALGLGGQMRFASITAPNYFLYGSLFLAFARLYPDFILNLFFVLPIRIRWLAMITWAGAFYLIFRGGWMIAMLVIASLANYLLFFGPGHVRQWKHKQRKHAFQAKAAKATKKARHECRVCGLNSDDSPRTLFRYCSQCSGQVCYCPDHIRDHEHVTEDAAAKS
ncbi:MAG: hypothetical protein CMJ58_25250 [Planctomycetaceae bacterium]|nr:hypothetical protein [Planctomycetaceae bacterium]